MRWLCRNICLSGNAHATRSSESADDFKITAYSQEGEDVLLQRLFGDALLGFPYVDVGANNPWKYSNTAYLYQKGGQGVIIEPNPSLCDLLKKERSRDICVPCGVSDKSREMFYYSFEEPLYNTFDSEIAEIRIKEGAVLEKDPEYIDVRTLNSILNDIWPEGKEIGLLSIDVEGFDLKALKSLDYIKFPPQVILVELENDSIDYAIKDSEISLLLKEMGFLLYSKMAKSAIFIPAHIDGPIVT